MRHLYFLFLTMAAFAGALGAQPKEVSWNLLCAEAGSKPIEITMQSGETVYGICSKVTDTEIAVRLRDRKVVSVARSALAKVEFHRAQGGQLKSLRRGFRKAMGHSVRLTFSPAAVMGLVELPFVAAWGVTALPFCALGDLGAAMAGAEEVRPI